MQKQHTMGHAESCHNAGHLSWNKALHLFSLILIILHILSSTHSSFPQIKYPKSLLVWHWHNDCKGYRGLKYIQKKLFFQPQMVASTYWELEFHIQPTLAPHDFCNEWLYHLLQHATKPSLDKYYTCMILTHLCTTTLEITHFCLLQT